MNNKTIINDSIVFLSHLYYRVRLENNQGDKKSILKSVTI